MRIFLIIFVVVLVLAAAVALLGGSGMRGSTTMFKSSPAGIEVRTAPVRSDRLLQTISAPGEIEPLTKVEISAGVSARIEQLPFRENDLVKKGDLLVKLDGRDLQAARDAARARRDGEKFRLESEHARIEGMVSSLAFAKRQLQRQEDLFANGVVPRKAVDDATERVDDLQSGVDAAKHSISMIESSLTGAEADILRAEEGLAKTVIHSPMDGVVTILNAEVGELVVVGTMNSPGTVIMRIADLSRMILNARVAETDISKVQAGQPAKIYINAYADDVFEGEVRRVALQRSASMGQESSYFKAEVNIDLKGRTLLSGLAANVDIQIAAHDGLIVPSQAIVDRLIEELPTDIVSASTLINRSKKSTTVVYRVVDGKTVCTPVKAGSSDLTSTVVLEGLSGDDQIIVGPYKVLSTIKHDVAVKEQPASGTTSAQPQVADEPAKSGVSVTVSSG